MDSVFTVHAGLSAYDSAVNAGANQRLAAAALAGNFLGVGIGLVDAFANTAPDPQEIISGQLIQLGEQIRGLRIEMHAGFQSIRAQLDEVFDAIGNATEIVTMRLTGLKSSLEIARYELRSVVRGQRDIRELILTQLEVMDTNLLEQHFTLAGCFDDALSLPRGPVEDYYEDFRRCVAGFGALARRLPRLQTPDQAADRDRLVNAHFKEFATLLQRAGGAEHTPLGAADGLVGPDAWFYVADKYDQYVAARPALVAAYREALDDTQVVVELRRQREQLRGFMNLIRGDLRAFQDDSRPSAFSAALEEARFLIESVRPAVEWELDAYYENEERSGGAQRDPTGHDCTRGSLRRRRSGVATVTWLLW